MPKSRLGTNFRLRQARAATVLAPMHFHQSEQLINQDIVMPGSASGTIRSEDNISSSDLQTSDNLTTPLFTYHKFINAKMKASRQMPRAVARATSALRPKRIVRVELPSSLRCMSQRTMPAMSASNPSKRPTIQPFHQPNLITPSTGSGSRTIFIQTEPTPNPDALKFLPNHPILPEGISTPFIEYMNPRSTLAPPYPSPLAANLMNIEGITSVFYGADFITVTKSAEANWAHIKPEVFSLITEAVTSGQTIVNVVEKKGEDGKVKEEEDSLAYNEDDDEVVGMIKELLETRIRPAIQEDGGDIDFRGFVDGNVLLKLRGACRTCDSSTVTLKNGIEGMLMHYVSFSLRCKGDKR